MCSNLISCQSIKLSCNITTILSQSHKNIHFVKFGTKVGKGSIEPRPSPLSQPHTKKILFLTNIDLILYTCVFYLSSTLTYIFLNSVNYILRLMIYTKLISYFRFNLVFCLGRKHTTHVLIQEKATLNSFILNYITGNQMRMK